MRQSGCILQVQFAHAKRRGLVLRLPGYLLKSGKTVSLPLAAPQLFHLVS